MGRNRQRQPGNQLRIPEQDLRIIIQGNDIESAAKTVEWAEKLGGDLAYKKLTTSQIRTIFGQVRQIEMNWPLNDVASPRATAARRDLLLLKPKLAYQAKREAERGKRALDDLVQNLTPAIDLVGDSRENFQRFVDFFEAILAYHKAAGGKD